jgi:predicted ferric reductase
VVPDWAQASVWFCGPADFGRSLGAELQRRGLPARRFHQELFEMR